MKPPVQVEGDDRKVQSAQEGISQEGISQEDTICERTAQVGTVCEDTAQEDTDREDGVSTRERSAGRQDEESTSLLHDIVALLVKMAVLFAAFWLLFNYVFGVHRYLSANMTPALRDGDLVLFFRLDHEYEAGDIVVFSYEGRTLMGRVTAVAGDTVDFDENGMMVNGSHVQEENIYSETTMFEEGITFPVRVGEDQIFVLGDNRAHATDSRIFGCIDIRDVEGKVIGLLRRRNL